MKSEVPEPVAVLWSWFLHAADAETGGGELAPGLLDALLGGELFAVQWGNLSGTEGA